MQGLIERKRTNRRKGSATTVLVLVQYSYGPFGFSRPYEYEYGTWYRVYNFPCKEDESGPFGTAFGAEISGKSRSISVATTSVQYLVALYRDVRDINPSGGTLPSNEGQLQYLIGVFIVCMLKLEGSR